MVATIKNFLLPSYVMCSTSTLFFFNFFLRLITLSTDPLVGKTYLHTKRVDNYSWEIQLFLVVVIYIYL